MNLEQLKERITGLIRQKIDKRHSYHAVDHTLMVMNSVTEFCAHEGVSGRDLELLQVAALFHDTGFLFSRIDHEKESCAFLRAELDSSSFSSEEIDRIHGMIMATRIPQSPETLFERILADADLHYLGTEEYDKYSSFLYSEIKAFNPDFSDEEWLQVQIGFLESHAYHTSFGKTLESKKAENLQRLKKEWTAQRPK